MPGLMDTDFVEYNGSYNLEKVLNLNSHLEKSLNLVKVLEKYLITLVRHEESLIFSVFRCRNHIPKLNSTFRSQVLVSSD